MKKVINRMLYDTEQSDIVATDKYWDGSNSDRHGRSQSLYKTKKGNFFMHYETRWQGEIDRMEAVSIEEAKDKYEELPVQEMDWEKAFSEKAETA